MSLMDLDRFMDWGTYGTPTYTGKSVSQTSALQVSAVWACVNRLASDLATAPLFPYRRTGTMLASGHFQRELATDHYLYPLVTHRANPEQTAWRFKHQMMTWLQLAGNAYAEIEINGRGQVTALWPWRPDRVKVSRDTSSGPLVYRYRMADGKVVAVDADRMLHLRGLSVDGVMGLSPIDMHKQGVALSMAMEEHGARFFGNGGRPLGALMFPNKLTAVQLNETRENWNAVHGGLNNAHRTAILQEGMTYQEIGMNMVDAQYLEGQKFSVSQIARIFGVPPHLIQDLDRATNNNIEHQGLEYISYGQGPWAANWTNEMAFALLSPREADSIFLEFSFEHLLRGDMAAQAEFFSSTIQNGVLLPDECREKLGYNPLPNGWGAVARWQMNMRQATDPAPDPNRVPPAEPGKVKVKVQ